MTGLEGFMDAHGGLALIGAVAALAAGGFTKGVVGFALPLIALSLMASFLPFQVALALLIVPTLASNLAQALRNGPRAALASLLRFWRLNLVLGITIALAAQLVVALPDAFFFALLGVTITAFGVSQLLGWAPHLPEHHVRLVELATGLVAGFFGGISGVWGPPIVMYLLSRRVPKVEMVRSQSISFLLGSVVLIVAHLKSGVLNPVTLPVSMLLVLPTFAAMLLGYRVQDRLDQELFRRVTLVVLMAAGLNLLRRALGG
ncbi:MAG: sulfite exporter TauE/SafE family protein [Rhodobacteraceae bacterium]|nr:sulfite exporter TauE/SafE family protein [Paracoccaceae bacterium]